MIDTHSMEPYNSLGEKLPSNRITAADFSRMETYFDTFDDAPSGGFDDAPSGGFDNE